MSNFYFDADADLGLLEGKTIAILGYGNQGRSQALNLKDNGLKVIIGNIEDDYAKTARADGWDGRDQGGRLQRHVLKAVRRRAASVPRHPGERKLGIRWSRSETRCQG